MCAKDKSSGPHEALSFILQSVGIDLESRLLNVTDMATSGGRPILDMPTKYPKTHSEYDKKYLFILDPFLLDPDA